MITQQQIEVIVNRIVQNANPKQVVLFGSYAYGRPNENSDLDILVVKDTTEPMNKRSAEILKLMRGLKVPVDVVVYTEEEITKWKDTKTSFISHVIAMGKVLYGK